MSEFRRDPISGDWVIISPGRAARPSFLEKKREPRRPAPVKNCPFEDLEKSGNWPPIAAYSAKRGGSRIVVIQNKYPVLSHGAACSMPFKRGMYEARSGVGRHELIITRDHAKNFAAIAPLEAKKLFGVFRDRIKSAAEDPCIVYAIPFFNWGPNAGASVSHPHYQLLATPFVPAHSAQSLANARKYFKKHRRCSRCDVIKEVLAEREKARKGRSGRHRVVAENKYAIAIAPYASKIPFEVRIMPKRHEPYFFGTPSPVADGVALLLQDVMRRLKKRVNDPDMNFFIHEAPLDGKGHAYHHWHVEVLPRLTIPAGFEFSTGMFIDIVEPEAAAAILRGETKAPKHYH